MKVDSLVKEREERRTDVLPEWCYLFAKIATTHGIDVHGIVEMTSAVLEKERN